jgi:hypothetical protein
MSPTHVLLTLYFEALRKNSFLQKVGRSFCHHQHARSKIPVCGHLLKLIYESYDTPPGAAPPLLVESSNSQAGATDSSHYCVHAGQAASENYQYAHAYLE